LSGSRVFSFWIESYGIFKCWKKFYQFRPRQTQQVCIPRACRGTGGLWIWVMRVRASVRRSVFVFFFYHHHYSTVRPWPVSVSPPPPPRRAQKNSSRFGRTGTGRKRVRVTVCDGGWCVRVRVRTRPDRRRRDRRIPISSAPRHTYRAGRSTTTVQHHTVRQCVCRRVLREVRVFARSVSDNSIFFCFKLKVDYNNSLQPFFSDFPFSVGLFSYRLVSRFPAAPRSFHTNVRPLTDRRVRDAGMTIIDKDGSSRHRTRQNCSQVSLMTLSIAVIISF